MMMLVPRLMVIMPCISGCFSTMSGTLRKLFMFSVAVRSTGFLGLPKAGMSCFISSCASSLKVGTFKPFWISLSAVSTATPPLLLTMPTFSPCGNGQYSSPLT